MHSDYLRRLFLDNDLAEGRYLVDSKPVTLSDLHMPMFVVGTQRDHVAPWKSTYKIHFLANADITFVLTSGGHNAGIVAPPTEEGHNYQVLTREANDPYVGPDEWIKRASSREGSWWAEWTRFLAAHSGQAVAPPRTGKLPTQRCVAERRTWLLRARAVRSEYCSLEAVSNVSVIGESASRPKHPGALPCANAHRSINP
jgi:polyhydroxyalkanoate synthase